VEILNIWTRAPRLEVWEKLVARIKNPKDRVEIGIVGKYVDLRESYKSLHEALVHGGIANGTKVHLEYISAEDLESKNVASLLEGCDGILVPGGFGKRGVEGKIKAINYARKNKVPFFGICLGMQLAVVEFARDVLALSRANSTELDELTPDPVIYLIKEWFDYRTNKMQVRDSESDLGGTMRLGAYPCILKEDSNAFRAYGIKEISERHRHRFEFNNEYRQSLEKGGLTISGASPDNNLVEIVEITDHPWFLGCQFHPEFKSKPMKPHPLFRDFISAALAHKQKD
jgi:CTP synthase